MAAHDPSEQLVVAISRARCSTSRKRTRSSKRPTTALTCGCSSRGWSSRRSRASHTGWCRKLRRSTPTASSASKSSSCRATIRCRACAYSARCKGAQLAIERGVFTRGRAPFGVPRAAEGESVPVGERRGRARGARRAVSRPRSSTRSRAATDSHPDEVRIAFDGDAVLFADEAERVFRSRASTRSRSTRPTTRRGRCRRGRSSRCSKRCTGCSARRDGQGADALRTALVTARSAPAHERAIRTLMDWNIEVDEAMFLGGLEKGPFLREFEPDFYLRRPDAPRRIGVASRSFGPRSARRRERKVPHIMSAHRHLFRLSPPRSSRCRRPPSPRTTRSA